jgi:hypothetical protein
MIWIEKTEVVARKSIPVSLRPPQIPRGMVCD